MAHVARHPAPATADGRPWLRTVAVAASVLLVAELLVRILAAKLPPTVAADDLEVRLKYERVRELAADDPAGTEVVVFGNSMMDAALSPEAFTAASRQYDTAYNAALLGAPLGSQARWAAEFVLDELDPRTVVLGVNPFDLLGVDVFGGQPANVADTFDGTFASIEPTVWDRLAEGAGRVSALVRHRAALRDPGTVWEAVTATVAGRRARANQGVEAEARLPDGRIVPRDEAFWRLQLRPTGGTSEFSAGRLDPTVADRIRGRMELAADAEYDVAGLRDLLDAAMAEGAEVVVVVPPLAYPVLATAGADTGRLREGVEVIAEQATAAGVPVVDFTEEQFPTSAFTDVAHLNAAGTERFSAQLAATLDGL